MVYLIAKDKIVFACVSNKKKAYSRLTKEIGEFSPSYATFCKHVKMHGAIQIENYKVGGFEVE